jgi:hypothetical protein
MSSRLYCTLDPACGPGLLVKTGNLIATTTQNALDIHRAIHGTLAVTSGTYYYEVIYWSTLQNTMANLVSFGVSQPQGDLAKYVGEETVSYGWRFADNGVYNNNLRSITVIAYPERLVFGCYVSLSPTTCTALFTVNGTPVASQTLPNGKSWVPAFTLSGTVAGDQQIQVNFGQALFDAPPQQAITSLTQGGINTGWSIQAPGLATLYLSKATEAFMSAHTDAPADQSYSPRILNPESFSIKRAPQHWVHRTEAISTTPVSSAFSTLLLDNSHGDFNALLSADARDSAVTMDYLDAPAQGFGSTSTSSRMFTANIATVSAPTATTVEVTLRGNIDRLDVPMKTHLIPSFYDVSSAGKAAPFGIGAQRNFNPPFLEVRSDSGYSRYLLGDIPFSDVPLVMDNAASLDPLVPQWVAALSGKAIDLVTAPVGKLSCDASTQGTQYTAGNPDALNGDGAFTTFTTGVPNGWTKAVGPTYPTDVVNNGTLSQITTYFGHASALRMTSSVPLNPVGVGYYFGYPITHSTFTFQPGRSYRVSFTILGITGSEPGQYGFQIVAGATTNSAYAVSDFLKITGTFAYEFTVPQAAGALPLILWLISQTGGTPPVGAAVVDIDDVKVEQLGQFERAPLQGCNLTSVFGEILTNHQGELTSIYSSTDTDAVHATTVVPVTYPYGYIWGLRFTEPPNVADALQLACDQYGAVLFEDASNVIRTRILTDPATGTPVALFDTTNVDPDSVTIVADNAPSLTTLGGARPNCDPNADNDFVSDTAIVTPATKEALKGTSQFEFSATVQPAQEYLSAQGAPRFHMRHDDQSLALTELNRVVSIWGQKYINGALQNGKRRIVTFTAEFDGLSIGAGTSGTGGAIAGVAPHQIYYNDVVQINLPKLGLNYVNGAVIATELFPFAGKITLDVLI